MHKNLNKTLLVIDNTYTDRDGSRLNSLSVHISACIWWSKLYAFSPSAIPRMLRIGSQQIWTSIWGGERTLMYFRPLKNALVSRVSIACFSFVVHCLIFSWICFWKSDRRVFFPWAKLTNRCRRDKRCHPADDERSFRKI